MLACAPAVVAPMTAPVVVRSLRVEPALHAQLAAATAPVSGELTLVRARIPAGGGSWRFYLVDANDPAAEPIPIGRLAIEGATRPAVGDVLVHVDLGPQALARLRTAHAPAIRIVTRPGRPEPLLAQAIELHRAP